jgi:predicted MPP superfamily phosphohydrolase
VAGCAVVFFWLLAYPAGMIGGYRYGFSEISQHLQKANLLSDLLVTYPFWIGVILGFELATAYLLLDLARLASFSLYKKRKVKWLKVHHSLVLILFGAAAVYACARVYNDTFTLRVTTGELIVEGMPPELDGFRIVQIADMQDMVTSGTDYIDLGAKKLGEMRATNGVYACLGDHDHFSDKNLVVASLRRNGISVVDNDTVTVSVGSANVSLTGITNVYRTRPPMEQLNALEKKRSPEAVNILLTHQPSPWLVDFAARNKYDLFLAGHTHGGQIAFPLPGLLVAPASLESSYVSGYYKSHRMHISVTNGLGLTLAPIRYHAPAEVTLLVLRSSKSGAAE